MARKFIKTWKYKAGYHVRYEELSDDDAGGGPAFIMRTAFTPNGAYIGNPKVARTLLAKRGIKPELIDGTWTVCSVGFRKEDQRWYGWSHRAMCSFGIGNVLFDEFWPEATEHTPFIEHGDVVIKTLDQARQAAANFAESVS